VIWAIVEDPTAGSSFAERVHQRPLEEIPMPAVASYSSRFSSLRPVLTFADAADAMIPYA
jgi:hypothetical protein